MSTKLQFYSEFAERTARQITGSYRSWTAFLATAARLYKYPYNEQLMIYAQRPNATACAEYDFWKDRMGRYVQRGSTGIALIDTSGYRPRLRYVFDVADTAPRGAARNFTLWEMRAEHEAAVSSMLKLDAKVSDPITYDYSDGWKTLLTRDFPTVFLLIALVVCIIISPVFAYEYQTGADAVVLSSKYGRRETVWAKLIAGFTVTSRIYFIAVLVSLISVLAAFGIRGWNCDFQILSTTAYYGLKIWQVVFVGIVINYVVVLSVMAFTMLLSAACKTPFAAVLISTLCTIVPMFLPTSRVSGVFNKLLCLLPAKAMDTHVVFSTYVLFSFGKLVIILPCMILIAACVLIIVTLPVAHRKFCRHQVA